MAVHDGNQLTQALQFENASRFLTLPNLSGSVKTSVRFKLDQTLFSLSNDKEKKSGLNMQD